MYKGIYTALIGPFKNNVFDVESFEHLITSQIQAGVDGFVVNGTTAESPNLNQEEVLAALHIVKNLCMEQKIIVGCGSNSTHKTISLAQALEKEGGFDAFLLVVPYYNKPTQEGLYQHFKAIHDNTNKDIILYNVPGRTITSLEPETCARLSKLDRIVGLKDATGDMEYYKKTRDLCGPSFSILSGDDATFAEFALLGGNGCISVLSHLFAAPMKACFHKAIESDSSAKADYESYQKICKLLFQEPSPAPVKYALKKMGIISENSLRLPLVTVTENLAQEIDQELQRLKVI
tara:strand:- start:11455 stop:12327 length:873 start_codon:yes stop_codon:yes gene_type:complete